MKNLFASIVSPLLVAGVLAGPSPATAQTSAYWDPDVLNASPGSGGPGSWNSTLANWWVSGTGDGVWASGNIANFAGTAGTVTLGAAETADGLTFTTAGYTLSGTPALTLAGSTPTVTIPAGTTTINCILAGTAGLALSGPGTLSLGGANTYSGGTTIPAGSTLQVTVPKGAGTGTIAITGNGTFTVNSTTANSVANAVANVITGGPTSVIKVLVNTTSANTYISGSLAGFTGTVNISSSVATPDSLVLQAAGPYAMVAPGTWNIAAGAQLDCAFATTMAANVIINGPGNSSGYGALRLNSDNVSGNITLAGTGTNVNNNQIGNTAAGPFTLSGVISDAGGGQGLNMVGYPAAPATILLSGENTYSGPTTLTSNTVRMASAENPGVSGPLGNPAIPANSILFPSSATLQFSSVNHYDYSSRFSGATNQHYSVDVNGQSVTFASALASSGGTFTLKDATGGGNLTLSGANTYSGQTTVNSGTLNILGSVAGNVVVNGGTLELSSSTALSSSAVLILPSSPASGQVNLNFIGTQSVSNLLFGAAIQSAGTWGPIGSSASFQNAAFTGTGILRVTTATSYPQAYWDAYNIAASPGGGGGGSWDSTTVDWWVTNNADTTWPANDVANFAGSPGTVILFTSETADGLNFEVDGYSIQPGNTNAVLTLAGLAPVVTVPTNGTAVINVPLAGTSGFVESGPGTLQLYTNSTYTGTTTVGSGSALGINSAGGAGGSTIVLNGTASFTVNSVSGNAATAADTIGNTISGGPDSVFTINEYTGNTFLTCSLAGFNGTINCLTGGGAASVVVEAAPPLTVPAAATWNIGNSATIDFNAGGTDAAHVILNGQGSYGNYGALRLDSCTQSGNILLTSTSDIGNAGTGTTSTISGVISDGGFGYGINRLGYPPVTNFIVLSGQNTYSGTTTLVSNTLRVASAEHPGASGPLGASATNNSGNIVFAGGILQYSSANQFDYSGRFGTPYVQPYKIDVNGQSVTFATALTSGAGTLTLSDSTGGGTLTLSAANTYAGPTTIQNGTLKISGSLLGNVALLAGGLELDSSSALAPTASLVLPASPSSGQVNLNFSGTQPISALFFGGVLEAAGTWGAVGSGAVNESAAFTGTGVLNITGQNYYYWDANGSDAASSANIAGGGSGSWDSGTADWWNTGNTDITWPTDGFAFFEGTAGTITLNNDETADNLDFTTSGYIINGGSTLTLGGAAPTVTIPSGGMEEIDCTLTGNAGLTEIGPGTLILGGVNNYVGPTTVAPGATLQISTASGAGSGTVTLNSNSVLTLNSVAGTVANSVNGPSASVINIQESSTANTYLSGSLAGFTGTINCLAGGPTVSAVVEATGPLTIPATATWNIASGATLDLNIGHTDNATVIVNGPGGSANFGALRLDSCTQAGTVVLAGPGDNNQIGSAGNGTVSTISGTIIDNGLGHGFNRVGYPPYTNVIALAGENTYTGATTLSSNTLRVASAEFPGVSGPLGRSIASNPGSIIFAGGTLQFSSANQHDYSGRFSTAAGQQYNIDVNGQAVTFATSLSSGAGALTLMDNAGGGALTLSATNSCNGGATVDAGTLDISATGSIAGNVIVNGGTLEMDSAAAMTPNSSLSMQTSATVNLNYSGTQTISGLLVNGVIQSPGVYGASANNPGGFIGAGTLTITGQPVVTISTAAIANNQFGICWSSVPGVNYNVYTSTNLGSPTMWTQINESPIMATGSTTCYTLPGNVTGQSRIFVTVHQ